MKVTPHNSGGGGTFTLGVCGGVFTRFLGRALLSCCWTGIRGADIDCERLAKGRGAMYNGIAVRHKRHIRIGSHDDGQRLVHTTYVHGRCRARCCCGWRYGLRYFVPLMMPGWNDFV